jgi:hypothetical protein
VDAHQKPSIYICSVAFLAATLGDALVESISNAQVLWQGHYTDRSSLDLLPMSAVALATFMTTLTLVVTEYLRRTDGSPRELWSSAARVLVPSDIPSLLPAIFALQIPTLFAMETVEQIVVYGHPLGETLWGSAVRFSRPSSCTRSLPQHARFSSRAE